MSEESLVESVGHEEILLQPRQQILEDLRAWIHDGREPGAGSDSRSHCTLTLIEAGAGVGKSHRSDEALEQNSD